MNSKPNKQKKNRYKGVREKVLSNGDIAYYVRFTKNNKQIERKVGTSNQGWNQKKAFGKKVELENDMNKNKIIIFKEATDRFLEVQKLRLTKESHKSYESRIRHLEMLNEKNIDTITQKDLIDIIVSLSDGFSNKTLNQIITLAKAILKFSQAEYGIYNKNLENFKLLKTDNARERFLSKEEIKRLKEALKQYSELLLFVNLSLCTGGRLMTILSIAKKDINIKTRTITLKDFKSSSVYAGFLDDETQNLILKKWDKLKEDDKIIQKSKKGIVYRLRSILNGLFNKEDEERKQKVVIHTLRHTFASHLAIKGVSIQIIQKLLNHKDIKMTMRYSHLMPHSGKEAVENLWN